MNVIACNECSVLNTVSKDPFATVELVQYRHPSTEGLYMTQTDLDKLPFTQVKVSIVNPNQLIKLPVYCKSCTARVYKVEVNKLFSAQNARKI